MNESSGLPSCLWLVLGKGQVWYEKLQLHTCEGHWATLDHYGIRNWLTRNNRRAICYNRASLTIQVYALSVRLNLGHYELFAVTGTICRWFIYTINSQDVPTITDNTDHETFWPLTLSWLISIYRSRQDIFKQAREINNNVRQWRHTSCLETEHYIQFDATEISPIDYRDDVDWDLPCLLTVAIPSVRLWPVSTSPKRFLLVIKFIIDKFCTNSMVRRMKGKASVPEGSVRARGESAGCRSMGLLYVASVGYYCFSRQQDTCKLERGCTVLNRTV